MWEVSDIVTIGSSLVLRSSSFVFLQWLPGHHFPPIILTSLAIYLASILLYHEYVLPLWWKRGSKSSGNAHGKHDELVHETADTNLETPAIYEEPKLSKIRNVLLSGLPHPRLRYSSMATILANILLAFFSMDFIFRAPIFYPAGDLRFSRLGFVDATAAKVLFREPSSNQLPVFAYYKAVDSTSWNLGDKIYYLHEESDFTYPVTFSPLRPETSYTYSLSNDLTGNFTTPPAAGSPAGNSLTFVTSSCIKANFPYYPFSHALDIRGFKHLSEILGGLPNPAQFMLFLGDFIYVDVPLRLSSTAAHYRAEYRRVYASRSWSLPYLSSLPWLHTIDDHEIANDWAGGHSTPPYPAARDPFRHYHVSVNPPAPPPSTEPQSNTSYFQFTQGPASFFMLETRAYRTNPINLSSPSLLDPNATILGPKQLSLFLSFLRAPEPRHVHWKIISSSVPFTKNWRFGNTDSWAGFPTERAKVLEAMHYAERHLGIRVIILSGDRHEFGAIRFPPPHSDPHSEETTPQSESASTTIPAAATTGPHEFSVGPLSMFYLPFPFRTFHQTDDHDVAIKYIPDGNSKVGVIHIEGVRGDRISSLLRYSLYVDGELSWEYVLGSPA